jgi:phosphatidate cytidylyltransferase
MAKKSVKSRLLFGSIMILVLGGLFGVDIHFYLQPHGADASVWTRWLGDGLLVAVIAGLLAAVAGFEVICLARNGGAKPHTGLVMLGTALFAFQPLLVTHGGKFSPIFETGMLLGILTVLLVCNQFIRRSTERAGTHLAWSVFTLVYIGVLLSFTVAVRRDFGPGALILMIAATKGSDIGAYFTGMSIGKHKLIPWLSPGKTIEGFVGAMVFSAIIAVTLSRLPYIINVSSLPADMNIIVLILLGGSFAVIGHVGDLAESLLKRDANAKDSAHLLPEFGGVLDLVDSILPAGLWWFLILTLFYKG